MDENPSKKYALCTEVMRAVDHYLSNAEQLSKNQVIADFGTVLFVLLGIANHFSGFEADIIKFNYTILGILSVWCLVVVILTSFELREMRIRLYKSVLALDPTISLEQIAEVSSIKLMQLHEDLKFCSKYNFPQTDCMELLNENKEEDKEPVLPDTGQHTATQVAALVSKLKEVNEGITDSELHKAVSNLIQQMQDLEPVLQGRGENFLDTYVSQLPIVLVKYKGLQKEVPDGYKELIEFISIVAGTMNRISEEDLLQKEMDFSTDVEALLMSVKMAGLGSEEFPAFHARENQKPTKEIGHLIKK